jgi:hypothetical protein
MRRREFIGLSAAAVKVQLAARAAGRVDTAHRRTHEPDADSPEGQARLQAFERSLEQLGWAEGGNMRIAVCWDADDFDHGVRTAK